MITCESFRNRFETGSEDPAVLEHLRSCDRCLDFAAHQDPDVMFRALGGEELVPPGGGEAFVDDVMQQVRVRGAESTLSASRRVASWPRRLAIAATIAAAVTGAMFYNSFPSGPTGSQPVVAIDAGLRARPSRENLATKPVVESYESENATIVEVPSDDDVKIVMIFDENLPADL
jgi:hypothetical protein